MPLNRTSPNQVERQCVECGRTFYAFAHLVRQGLGKFCTISCSKRGKNNHRWRGGRSVTERGYVLIHVPDHPHATYYGYVAEHRLVMEAHLDRYLAPEEVVHHRGDLDDNRIEMLELMPSNVEHLRLRHAINRWAKEHDACIGCGTSSAAHQARGYCARCYWRAKRAGNF